MKLLKPILLLAVCSFFYVGCTVHVHEPAPRSVYVVKEVSYNGPARVEVFLSDGVYYYCPSSHIHSRYHYTRVVHYDPGHMRIIRHVPPKTVVLHRPQTTVVVKQPAPPPAKTVIVKKPVPAPKKVIVAPPPPKKHHHHGKTVIIKK